MNDRELSNKYNELGLTIEDLIVDENIRFIIQEQIQAKEYELAQEIKDQARNFNMLYSKPPLFAFKLLLLYIVIYSIY